jgi:hypothetical protein
MNTPHAACEVHMAATVLVAIPLVSLIAAAVLPEAFAGQAPPRAEPAPATVALVERWPNGRVIYELTGPRRASMWTPVFPRVDGYKPPEGAKPVHAVQFTRTLVGEAIRVEVSVLLGSTEQPGVPVATVSISPGSEVVVDQLIAFGVQPVTLSMVDVAPLTPFVPTVVSVSPAIEVANVDVRNAPYPGYRITLRNLGDQAVSNIHVESFYGGGDKALSALKRTDDGRPMMQPGERYAFDLNLTTGGAGDVSTSGAFTPRPIEVIELDSVRWADGTHHGNPPFAHMEPAIESRAGRKLQLRRIIDVLRQTLAERNAGPELLAAAANRLGALPDAEPDQLEAAKAAMRATKAAVVLDVERFAADHATPPDTAAVVAWLTHVLARYEGWLARLSPP